MMAWEMRMLKIGMLWGAAVHKAMISNPSSLGLRQVSAHGVDHFMHIMHLMHLR